MVDSSKWEVIEAGLKCVQGKGLVNSISLKEGEENSAPGETRPALRRGGVVMAFDERGQADSYERRIEVCQRAYDCSCNRSASRPRTLFRSKRPHRRTGMEEHANYAVDFIRATKWIKENLPRAIVSAAGSAHVSFRSAGKQRRPRSDAQRVPSITADQSRARHGHRQCGMLEVYEEVPKELLETREDVCSNRSRKRPNGLINLFAETLKKKDKVAAAEDEWRKRHRRGTPQPCAGQRHRRSHRRGHEEAREKIRPPAPGHRRPAHGGMNVVGDLFGSGKCFCRRSSIPRAS